MSNNDTADSSVKPILNITNAFLEVAGFKYPDKTYGLITNQGNIFVYSKEQHCYQIITDEELRNLIIRTVNEGRFALKNTTTPYLHSLLVNIKAICEKKEVLSNKFIGEINHRNQHFTSFENVILGVQVGNKSMGLFIKPHASNFFTKHSLSYRYARRAGCRKFIKFLHSILDSDEIKLLQEWFGYSLIPVTKAHKMMVFQGRGRNGKSVVLVTHRLVLGVQNVSSITLNGFMPNARFTLVKTIDKLLNQVEEVDEQGRLVSAMIKRYVAGGVVQGEAKFKDTEDFYPTARIEISTNQDLQFQDESDALRERLIILPFRKQFLGKNQNKSLVEEDFWIESGELSGIRNWSIRGLKRLIENDWNFTEVESVTKSLSEYKKTLNPAVEFLKDYLEESPRKELFAIDIYNAYEEHCHHYGIKPKDSAVFSKDILSTFPSVTKSDSAITTKRILKNGKKLRSHQFTGIKFKDDPVINTATQVQHDENCSVTNSEEVLRANTKAS